MPGDTTPWIVAKQHDPLASQLPPLNTIFIRELHVETRIGVYEWEQHIAQPLLLNVEFEMPSAKAFASDKLADTVNYAAIVERLQAFAADHPHKLLERFSDAVAEIVRGEFGAPWVRVSVAKLAPMPGVKQIGVTIERGMKS
jgi:7,8-dihydroneopterin aldolase/epimerase/oxygenase